MISSNRRNIICCVSFKIYLLNDATDKSIANQLFLRKIAFILGNEKYTSYLVYNYLCMYGFIHILLYILRHEKRLKSWENDHFC